jgi:hypothetical protein
LLAELPILPVRAPAPFAAIDLADPATLVILKAAAYCDRHYGSDLVDVAALAIRDRIDRRARERLSVLYASVTDICQARLRELRDTCAAGRAGTAFVSHFGREAAWDSDGADAIAEVVTTLTLELLTGVR